MTETAEPASGSLASFHERSSQSPSTYIESLLADPETALSEEQLQAAYAFAKGLFAGEVEGIVCESPQNMEQIRRQTSGSNIQTFYFNYFKTEPGKADLAALGVKDPNIGQISRSLLDIKSIKELAEDTVRKQIAIRSQEWYKQMLQDRLLLDPEQDALFEDEPNITVNYDPDVLLGKIEGLQAHRRFFREIRKQLPKDNLDPLAEAKHVLLDIYISRATSNLADIYPEAIDLGIQLAASDDGEQSTQWSARLREALPLVSRAVSKIRGVEIQTLQEFRHELAQRLDFLKQGAAWQEDGNLSSVSLELVQLADELARESSARSLPESQFTPEEEAILDSTTWDMRQIQVLMEDVAQKWDLLSEVKSTWEEVQKRDGPAEDGKWQFVLRPSTGSMMTSGAKRVIWIYEDDPPRTLTQVSPAGVLLVVPHELKHLLQEEYNHIMAEKLPIARTINKRLFALQEAGTIYEESVALAKFGRLREPKPHYLNALKAKLSGANKMQTIRTYFTSSNPDVVMDEKKTKKSRKTAVGAALRLYRHDGYNSQPLDYIESELISRELRKLPEEKAEAIMTAATAFTLREMALLHRFRLLDIPEKLPYTPTEDVFQVFKDKYWPAILEEAHQHQ